MASAVVRGKARQAVWVLMRGRGETQRHPCASSQSHSCPSLYIPSLNLFSQIVGLSHQWLSVYFSLDFLHPLYNFMYGGHWFSILNNSTSLIDDMQWPGTRTFPLLNNYLLTKPTGRNLSLWFHRVFKKGFSIMCSPPSQYAFSLLLYIPIFLYRQPTSVTLQVKWFGLFLHNTTKFISRETKLLLWV